MKHLNPGDGLSIKLVPVDADHALGFDSENGNALVAIPKSELGGVFNWVERAGSWANNWKDENYITSVADVTVTLAALVVADRQKSSIVQNPTGVNVTIQCQTGETINGVEALTLSGDYKSFGIKCAGDGKALLF